MQPQGWRAALKEASVSCSPSRMMGTRMLLYMRLSPVLLWFDTADFRLRAQSFLDPHQAIGSYPPARYPNASAVSRPLPER